MFTAEDRARLRSELLERASRDGRVIGAAITGSAADGREDAWSDIDLAFGVKDAAALPAVLSDFTAQMYERHLALHHMDVRSGAWLYRVFLLASSLQVDLAFVPASEFRPLAPTFRLVFGEANELHPASPVSPADMIGLGWLHALHVRSCLARGNLWQAEYMISHVRDHALALACLRHGLPTAHGRGIDRLPAEVRAAFEDSLAQKLDSLELTRAFRVVTAGFLHEIEVADAKLAERLHDVLMTLPDRAT